MRITLPFSFLRNLSNFKRTNYLGIRGKNEHTDRIHNMGTLGAVTTTGNVKFYVTPNGSPRYYLGIVVLSNLRRDELSFSFS